MSGISITRGRAILGALVLLGIEAAVLTWASHGACPPFLVIELTFVLNGLLKLLVLLRLGLRASHLKAHWMLMIASLILGLIANVWDALGFLFQVTPTMQSLSGRDLLSLCTYIPIFLLLSLPAGRRYFRHFLWIDLIQVLAAACLLYALIFHALPFLHTPAPQMSEPQFAHLFELIDMVVCLGALLHAIAAVDADELRFFRYYGFIFLVATIINATNDEIAARYPTEIVTNLLQYAWMLAAVVIYMFYPAENAAPERRHTGNLASDLINIASPALPSAALLALGIAVQARHRLVGTVSAVLAFLLFAIRSTFYQRSFERSQQSLERARDHLEHISMVDELTGIANRRAFDRAFTLEWERCARSGAALSLILIDVDSFKQLNDRFGHQAGDVCLARIAQGLGAALPRSIDTIGRYGGDEFAVLLPSTGSADAEVVADRLSRAVAELAIENPATATGRATISMGVGSCEQGDHFIGRNPKQLLRTADEALYRAKASGRNGWRSGRLVIAEDSANPDHRDGLELA